MKHQKSEVQREEIQREDVRFPYAARGIVIALMGAVSVYTLLGVIVWVLLH